MATGDINDVFKRIRTRWLPRNWFPPIGQAPYLDAETYGAAYVLSQGYTLTQWAQLQTRISTATDGFLDMVAWDFFGPNLLRRDGQSDYSFRATLLAALVQARATRPAMTQVLTVLTGRAPEIIEPNRPAGNIGAYGAYNSGYGVMRYGSLAMPFEVLINAKRPVGGGVTGVAGYGTYPMGYGAPSAAYVNQSQVTGAVTDADIYAAIDRTKAAGTTCWTNISN